MLGNIMQWPLTISSVFRHAVTYHKQQEIVSVTSDQPLFRYSFESFGKRVCQLANALKMAGVKSGDRIATMAWNDHRHLELYYAISGIGAICHTLNPRLSDEQVEYIFDHAEDSMLFIDPTFVQRVAPLAAASNSLKNLIILNGEEPEQITGIKTHGYESFIDAQISDFLWPEFDEHTACALCYTSGTTGNPKGVLYSHRSAILHALSVSTPNALGMGMCDSILPVVPLFHVNAWGIPYAALMHGAKLVLPGSKLDGESLYRLLEGENVSITAGVPTVWLGLQRYMEENRLTLPSLQRIVVGGSAAPASMIEYFEEAIGAEFLHAWGMTEMSPTGTVCRMRKAMHDASREVRTRQKLKQGVPIYGVELKLVDEEGVKLPYDGEAKGDLWVRGAWIVNSYFKNEEANKGNFDDEGFFNTGDVSTIDQDGYMRICDRSKDVIKSGGEWISSIDLENAAVGHHKVAEAAVIGVPCEKWQERPLLIVVPADNANPPSLEEVCEYLNGKVPKWWLPTAMELVDALPHTATGKIQKRDLREKFSDYRFTS